MLIYQRVISGDKMDKIFLVGISYSHHISGDFLDNI
jgi:hypothetical protein